MGAARARHRLSVALHVLRQGLGHDVLVTAGDSVTLNGVEIRADAGAFLAAIAEGRAEEAVAGYGGPFLDGFYLRGAPDFERWVDGERNRFEGLFRSMLERLASEAERAGELGRVVELRRTLSGLAPYEASVAVALMRALAANGDLAGALQQARAHIARVEGELGIPASPKVREFLDQLSNAVRTRREEMEREGDALVPIAEPDGERAQATRSGSSGPIAVAPSVPVDGAGMSAGRRRHFVPWMATIGAVLTGVALWTLVSTRGPQIHEGDPSVAVLPFEVAGGGALATGFGEALAEAVRGTLAFVPNLSVRRGQTAVTARSSIRTAQDLGATRVVTGTIEPVGRTGDTVRATVRLAHVRSGEVEWEGRYERPLAAEDVMIELLSMFIADDLRLRVAPYIPDHYTSSEVANDEFLSGVFEHRRLTEERLWVAIQHYRRATERDPTFALAWAIMGGAYIALAGTGLTPEVGYEEARRHVERALELDPQLAEGYSVLARLQFFWDRDFAGAEQSLRHAFMLYPTHPDCREWYGWYLLFVRGDAERAMASVRRALELDPLNTARSRAVERILYMARRFDEIPEQARHTWSLDPDVAATIAGPFVADAYREMGLYEEAIREYRLYQERRRGRSPFGLAITYAKMGRAEEARAIIREWEAVLGTGTFRGLAIMHAALGNLDEAFEYLERMVEIRPTGLLSLEADVDFDPLRSDPRFDDLVRRMGLAD
jgi:DNA-binding SARP family transcriptional activator/TolB-like protein/Tfp pilus assembly protein PilF